MLRTWTDEQFVAYQEFVKSFHKLKESAPKNEAALETYKETVEGAYADRPVFTDCKSYWKEGVK